MRKMIVFISALIVLLIICSSCGTSYPYRNMEIRETNEMGMSAFEIKNLSDLEEHSAAIVSGWVHNDGVRVNRMSSDDTRYAMKSTMEVTKAYKGDIEEGTTIQLIEDWYIDETEDNTLIVRDGYMPSDVNQEYIFFLGKNGERSKFSGCYGPLFNEASRFPVPRSAMMRFFGQDELYMRDPTQLFYDIYEEVQEKYLS